MLSITRVTTAGFLAVSLAIAPRAFAEISPVQARAMDKDAYIFTYPLSTERLRTYCVRMVFCIGAYRWGLMLSTCGI
ncbi:hypothetical protein D3C77_145630 [compost metagenome]